MTAEERERWKKVETALRNFDQRLAKIEKELGEAAGTPGVEGRLKNLEERVESMWKTVNRLKLKDPNLGKVRG